MRISFADLARPKQAAKNLVRMSSELKLATAQEALARVLGYRDWHEFSVSICPVASPTSGEVDDNAAMRIVLDLSDALGLPDSDVQYAISKARLLPNMPWPIDDQLRIRARIWRERVFGPPGQGNPGTVVRQQAYGSTDPAYLRQAGQPSYLLLDTGMATVGDFEVVMPRTPLADFVPSRLWLPYGYWTLEDNSEVLFSRDYCPMWQIMEGTAERLDPWLQIDGIVATFHFSASLSTAEWASNPARDLALQHMSKHRIFEPPKLVDVMPHLFDMDVRNIADGVKRLHEQRGAGTTTPA